MFLFVFFSTFDPQLVLSPLPEEELEMELEILQLSLTDSKESEHVFKLP